jgi:hypothetical protein
MDNYFTTLASVDCSKHTEKKGGFTYLSWAFAVKELLTRHPDATWRVYEDANGAPFMATALGYFVKVGVTVNGIERVQVHPVLDGANRPVKEPNPFHINTSIQRALVKAIALHGLGLYIYAGEDLPDKPEEPPVFQNQSQRTAYIEGLSAFEKANDPMGTRQLWDELNNEQREDIWDAFSAAERRHIKDLLKQTAEAAKDAA